MLACPVNAITKRKEDGIVVVNSDKCLGKSSCKMLCKRACPYGAPQFGEGDDAKMEKCDLCLRRLMENKKPICVEACPMRALDAGPLDDLKARYGSINETEGFVYFANIEPHIIFRPKR
jgi:anaerobic dimethyl sulfoxide reductase subunit B (iron-sulfur subunit)